MSKDHVDRAVKILKENRFLTLATCSNDEAWAAPINYVIGSTGQLYYYSARKARHSQDIEKNPRIMCAVYNSTAVANDIDGMQFVGHCTVVSGLELEHVAEYYFRVNFPDPKEREWWYRPHTSFSGEGPWRFYKIDPINMYIIDIESVIQTKIDRRITVDVKEVLNKLTNLYPTI